MKYLIVEQTDRTPDGYGDDGYIDGRILDNSHELIVELNPAQVDLLNEWFSSADFRYSKMYLLRICTPESLDSLLESAANWKKQKENKQKNRELAAQKRKETLNKNKLEKDRIKLEKQAAKLGLKVS